MGMLEAYRREQKLAAILNQNEEDGIRINQAKLEHDLGIYEVQFAKADAAIQSIIGTCNLDSASEFAARLISSGRCSESDFKRTPTGKISVAKGSLDAAVKDPELRQLATYRSNLRTVLTTFMRPWVEIAHRNGGRLHPEFNQVRGDIYGTRTGRLSSSNPNLQNVPTEFKSEAPAGFPPLPYMRQYVLPDEGHVLVASDFNGQEMRIAAHFAEGRAAEIYRNDPSADFHKTVSKILETDAGLKLDHKLVKITGFSLIYGSGVNALADLLGVDRNTASTIRAHYFQVLPGFKELMDDVSKRGRQGLPVKTWGGRLIHAEKGKLVNGQHWTFEYKLLNYLIQGSAADQTKEAINATGYRTPHRRFLATVHDENVFSVSPDHLEQEIAVIKDSMESQPGWDVPFKAKVEVGPNWWDIN
jgi:DNA polymerase-1